LNGPVAVEVDNCIRAFSEQKGCEIVELNIQIDHVHLLVMVPPKVSISDYVGTIKGRSAIRVFNKFKKLKDKPYWGNKFWSRGILCTPALHKIFQKSLHFYAAFCNTSIKCSKFFLTAGFGLIVRVSFP